MAETLVQLRLHGMVERAAGVGALLGERSELRKADPEAALGDGGAAAKRRRRRENAEKWIRHGVVLGAAERQEPVRLFVQIETLDLPKVMHPHVRDLEQEARGQLLLDAELPLLVVRIDPLIVEEAAGSAPGICSEPRCRSG